MITLVTGMESSGKSKYIRERQSKTTHALYYDVWLNSMFTHPSTRQTISGILGVDLDKSPLDYIGLWEILSNHEDIDIMYRRFVHTCYSTNIMNLIRYPSEESGDWLIELPYIDKGIYVLMTKYSINNLHMSSKYSVCLERMLKNGIPEKICKYILDKQRDMFFEYFPLLKL